VAIAQTTTITVQEIHCQSCERTIAMALSKLNGVLRVVPSAKINQVRVCYDELVLDKDDLRLALAEIGYDPLG
jgi:copper chaperone CopZ